MATKKIKSKAQAYASQSRDDAQADIKTIGDLQREHTRLTADLNDAVSKLVEAAAPTLKDLSDQITRLQVGVQTWCEAHREELCGKGKSANLVTGEVTWRIRPPSVNIKGEEAVIALLKSKGLTAFVHTKETVNKQAMLNDKDKARGLPGVTIITDVEDFAIVPFEVNTEAA